MQRSIAAKYTARPAARFVRPSSRSRERRLGLRATASFHAVVPRATVLRRADLGPLISLRASWRTIHAAQVQRSRSGRPRPVVTMHWARSVPGSERRSSVAPAPWRG